MIDIRINGQSLDLLQSTTIRLEWSNPIWDWETIPGATTFPFTLPDTDRNRGLLDYAKVIQRRGGGVSRVACELYVGGLPFMVGQLVIQKATNNSYSCYISSQAGDMAASIEGLGLRDLELGGPRNMGTNAYFWKAAMITTTTVGPWPASDFVFFPIRNTQFGSSDDSILLTAIGGGWTYPGTVICPVQNYWHGGEFFADWFQDFSPLSWEWDVIWTVPFVYVNYILHEIFALGGYKMTGSWLRDPELSTLVVNSVKAEVPGHHQDGLGNFLLDLPAFMPDMTIAEFLIGLRKAFCMFVFFDSRAKTVELTTMKDVLNSSEREEWTDKANPAYEISDEDQDTYRWKFTMDNNDKLMEDAVMDLRGSLHLADVADDSLLPPGDEPGAVRFVQDDYYFWSMNRDGTVWHRASLPFYDEGDSAATQTVEIPFSPVATWRGVDTIPTDYAWITPPAILKFWKLPNVEQAGNFVWNAVHTADFAARLLFYRGMVEDSNGDLYPFGTSDNYDWAANRIGEYSLMWQGEDGLVNRFWKEWITFAQATRRVRRRVNLGLGDLLGLDLKVRKRIDGVDYFVEKMTVQISMTGIEPADITFLKA